MAKARSGFGIPLVGLVITLFHLFSMAKIIEPANTKKTILTSQSLLYDALSIGNGLGVITRIKYLTITIGCHINVKRSGRPSFSYLAGSSASIAENSKCSAKTKKITNVAIRKVTGLKRYNA